MVTLTGSKALRGAAESFGVVTSFYLATKPAPTTVIQWSFVIPGMYSSAAQSASNFLKIQTFARNSAVVDRKIGFGIYMDGSLFRIGGTYFGSLDTFNNKVCCTSLSGVSQNLSITPIDQTRTLAGTADAHHLECSGC